MRHNIKWNTVRGTKIMADRACVHRTEETEKPEARRGKREKEGSTERKRGAQRERWAHRELEGRTERKSETNGGERQNEENRRTDYTVYSMYCTDVYNLGQYKLTVSR